MRISVGCQSEYPASTLEPAEQDNYAANVAEQDSKLFEPLALLALRTLKPDLERWAGKPSGLDKFVSQGAAETVALKVAMELTFRSYNAIESELRSLVGRSSDLREAGTLLAEQIDDFTDSVVLKALVLRQAEYYLTDLMRSTSSVLEEYAKSSGRSDIKGYDHSKAPSWARDSWEDLRDRDRRGRPSLHLTIAVIAVLTAVLLGLTISGRMPWPALLAVPLAGGLLLWSLRLEVLTDYGDELESYLASVDPEYAERRVRAFLSAATGAPAEQQMVDQVMLTLFVRAGDRLAEFMDDETLDDVEAWLTDGDATSVLRAIESANPFYGVVVRQELNVLLSGIASSAEGTS